MVTNTDAPHSDLPDDADGAIRQLYSDHAEALLSYARWFCLDQPGAGDQGDESTLGQVLDRQLLRDALQRLSPAHRNVLVETFYHGGTTAVVARRLGIPHGTARSRLHYALHALRAHLQDQYAAACP